MNKWKKYNNNSVHYPPVFLSFYFIVNTPNIRRLRVKNRPIKKKKQLIIVAIGVCQYYIWGGEVFEKKVLLKNFEYNFHTLFKYKTFYF